MAKVILIDDHHIVRQGLEFLLSTVADLEVLASLSDGQSLINYLNENDIPDIILLDLVMPEMNGIEVTEYVKSHFPDIKVLDVEPQKLIQTIHDVLNNKRIIHPEAQSVIETVSSKPHNTNKLSKREIEVLAEMVKGKTNKEIANTLFVSEKTIKTHVSHIFNKLSVTDRTQAAIYAIENKLV